MLAGFSLQSDAGRAQVAEAADRIGLSTALWSAVLDARARNAGSGNRRRLFSALDALFDGPAPMLSTGEPQAVESDRGLETSGDRVVLKKLLLKNWKVFKQAEFAFPDFDEARPVVLIGGKNGYGKTSFLEGLLHGLFGRDATVDLETALNPGATSVVARSQNYKQTLERALHRPARERGAGVMSVRSEWSTGEGDLIVERRWYFDGEGHLVEDDEGLNIWIGPDKDVLPVPDGETAAVFYQAEIARRLMPPSLAAFVLFDGEQVKRFAQRDFADQVRVAVETVLGLTVWRDAISDLRDYARDRSKGAIRNEEGDRLTDERLLELETAEHGVLAAIDTVQAAASPLRGQRDDVLARLGALSGRTYATMQEMLERRQALSSEQARARHELALAASTELPFLLVGRKLRSRLTERLVQDREIEGVQGPWAEPAILELLLSGVARELEGSKSLPMMEKALRNAWASLAATGATDQPLAHPYVSGQARDAAISRLSGTITDDTVQKLAQSLDAMAAELAAIDRAVEEREAQDRASITLRHELEAVTRDLEAIDDQRRVLDQSLGRIQSDLRDLRAQAESRLIARLSDAQLIVRRQAALKAAEGGEALIEALKPACFDAVGSAVTEAYAALAHKGLVSRITIDPDGRVVLVDGRGVDVRAIEASAGESQIFAMALMAAVAQLAGQKLPSIIDTPLGRLDPDHRKRVLAFFTSRDVQTILLSQPDEVNQQYLDLIDHRIAASFHLDHTLLAGGPGRSTPLAGYFPEIAA